MLAGRRSQRSSTKNKSRTICIGGAACALLIWLKPTWIGRKSINKWIIGTETVGIGIRITTAIRSSRATEYSTAHSVGVSIHRLRWALRRFSSSATSTIILIATSIALAIESVMKLTTTITSITASTTGLAIPNTADS